ncbi:hypothetical protein HMI54_007462 [Coelomomyces lativittatus]|nr:hypothetical protein HMI54_007462 [Coelomomyces lativittatus]KAJ1505338.1 hypothetical protein HMI55_001639 [Coelomomyces lativittatus]KAJ1506972.1 hypothetical protein HMI56_000352 [Coelomomyces lativittatus]
MDSLVWVLLVLLFLALVSFFIGSPPANVNEHLYTVTDEMISQVLAMFPDLDRSSVRSDLQSTGSVQATVENVLAGKIRRNVPSTASSTTTTVSKSTKMTSEHWDVMIRNSTLREQRLKLVQSFRGPFLEKEKSLLSHSSMAGSSSQGKKIQ